MADDGRRIRRRQDGPAVASRQSTMAQIAQQHAYPEGRCRQCGWRVVVTREESGHTRNGRWCGPVETDRPFVVTDDPPELIARQPFMI